MKPKKHELKAVDFFCSAGGITNGFRKAGIKVLGGIDVDDECKDSYEYNNPGSIFINSDIKKLTFDELKNKLKLKLDDDNLIFIGCSPCQYWSKIKTDKTKSNESKNLLNDFMRFVEHFKPGFIVIENVPGILRKIDESPLKFFLKFLKREKYNFDHSVINSCHYGVPQTRKRFLLIASRVSKVITLPIPDSAENIPNTFEFIGDYNTFPPIPSGHKDLSSFLHSSAKLNELNLIRLSHTPIDGGNRLSYYHNKDIAITSHYNKTNFSDSYSRLFWKKPAPTITTRFNSISNGRFAHPEQNRGLSLREGATLQTFDLEYKFFGKNESIIAKQIGNAVPPILAYKIAKSIIGNHLHGK